MSAPALTLDWARAVARRGMPLAQMLRVLRAMQAAYSAHGNDGLRAADAPAEVVAEALAVFAELGFAYIDAIAGPMVEAYEAERATHFADVATIDLLTRDVQAARAFAARELGELGRGDQATTRLREALRVFVEEGESYARAARRLDTHPNTIAYRVRRALDLAGQGELPSEAVRIALLLAPLLGDAEVTPAS